MVNDAIAVSQGMLSFDTYGLDLARVLRPMEIQWKTGFKRVNRQDLNLMK